MASMCINKIWANLLNPIEILTNETSRWPRSCTHVSQECNPNILQWRLKCRRPSTVRWLPVSLNLSPILCSDYKLSAKGLNCKRQILPAF
ncbi:Uncharacterized protein HZ326_17291 [Fusarium oxysporum f. sp. albedinis]|nr:Uncharacterized protein HZ326_17291 [Fusarium oxysporum f. sp. albedinis]